jgi:hypothetical protein
MDYIKFLYNKLLFNSYKINDQYSISIELNESYFDKIEENRSKIGEYYNKTFFIHDIMSDIILDDNIFKYIEKDDDNLLLNYLINLENIFGEKFLKSFLIHYREFILKYICKFYSYKSYLCIKKYYINAVNKYGGNIDNQNNEFIKSRIDCDNDKYINFIKYLD